MNKDKKANRNWIYLLIFSICIVVSVVLVILFLLNGSSKIEGVGEIETTESVVCEGDNISYPLFDEDDATKKTIKINILTNHKKLDTISLIYSMKYASNEAAEKSSVNNHIALNRSFTDSSLGADSFDARFMNHDKEMQMTLYADAKKINGVSAKYFLIDSTKDMTINTLTKNYNSQGLDCVINNKS